MKWKVHLAVEWTQIQAQLAHTDHPDSSLADYDVSRACLSTSYKNPYTIDPNNVLLLIPPGDSYFLHKISEFEYFSQ